METEEREEQLREFLEEQRGTDRGEESGDCIGYWYMCQCPRCQNLD